MLHAKNDGISYAIIASPSIQCAASAYTHSPTHSHSGDFPEFKIISQIAFRIIFADCRQPPPRNTRTGGRATRTAHISIETKSLIYSVWTRAQSSGCSNFQFPEWNNDDTRLTMRFIGERPPHSLWIWCSGIFRCRREINNAYNRPRHRSIVVIVRFNSAR